MDMSNTCKLISWTYTTDDYGVQIKTETEKEVFCQVKSVTGTEWHEAGRNGIKAQYQISVFKYDYDGQEILDYNDARYSVYRTYDRTDDFIELYVEKRAGA